MSWNDNEAFLMDYGDKENKSKHNINLFLNNMLSLSLGIVLKMLMRQSVRSSAVKSGVYSFKEAHLTACFMYGPLSARLP